MFLGHFKYYINHTVHDRAVAHRAAKSAKLSDVELFAVTREGRHCLASALFKKHIRTVNRYLKTLPAKGGILTNGRSKMPLSDIRTIAPDLELTQNGWWASRTLSGVAYPEEGNSLCFAIEDASFWFQHRNRCILEAMLRFPPSGALFDIGGGNGCVARAIQESGHEVVLVEPGLVGVQNALKRGIRHVVRATLEVSARCPKPFRRWACLMSLSTSRTTPALWQGSIGSSWPRGGCTSLSRRIVGCGPTKMS